MQETHKIAIEANQSMHPNMQKYETKNNTEYKSNTGCATKKKVVRPKRLPLLCYVAR